MMRHVTKYCNMWTALYSAAGHGLYTQFTRPFPSFAEVGLACETNPEQDSGIKVPQSIHFHIRIIKDL